MSVNGQGLRSGFRWLSRRRRAQTRQPLIGLGRIRGALVLLGNGSHDLAAENRDRRRRFDAKPHAFAVAGQYDHANAALDDDGVTGLPAQNQHALTTEIAKRLGNLGDHADQAGRGSIRLLLFDQVHEFLIGRNSAH